MYKSDFKSYDKEYFQKLINESTSVSELLNKLGLVGKGYNHTKLTKFLKESDYDTSSLVGRHVKRYSDKGIPKKRLSDILCENSTGNSNKLKKRLIAYGVKEYKCENPECGISEWHGVPIELELHHINGNHYDNRLENLVLLCPNCHSQTSNFRGKNASDTLNKTLSKVAIDESKTAMENLLEFEKRRKEEIYNNKIKYGEIPNPNKLKKEKVIKYCKQCGKLIEGKGNVFCSTKCMNEYNKIRQKVKTEDIILKANECSSLLELSKYFNLSDSGIKKRLKQEGKYEEVKEIIENNKNLKVLQFDLNGNFIKEWPNGRIASKELNIRRSYIYKCCNNQTKSTSGYIWKWKDR